MIEEWKSRAVCTSEDDPTPSYKNEALGFIQKNCINCPVVSECHESATESDLFWSIRGGVLPTRYNSGKSSVRKKWIPKGPPAKPRQGKTILDRGICLDGLHGILSSEDVRNKGCRACQNMKARGAITDTDSQMPTCRSGHPKTPENRGSLVTVRKGVPSTETYCIPCKETRRPKDVCKNGHSRTEENGRFVPYEVRGKTFYQWSCRTCRATNRVKGKLSGDTMAA